MFHYQTSVFSVLDSVHRHKRFDSKFRGKSNECEWEMNYSPCLNSRTNPIGHFFRKRAQHMLLKKTDTGGL